MTKVKKIILPALLVLMITACENAENNEAIPNEINQEDIISDIMPCITDANAETSDSEPYDTASGLTEENTPESVEPGAFKEITAAEWAADIRIGWSLGNTLDAHDGPDGFSWLGGGLYENTSVTELETGWGRPLTIPEHFAAINAAGFNAVRIPVTWYKVCDAGLNIRDDWMTRVKEVVDYAVALDMYIIINTHHDDVLFKLHDSEIEESKKNLAKIWEQIADTFKDYNEKLAFEGLNEPRTIGSAAEWRGGTPEEQSNLNILNQTFVGTVRISGGNNPERVLLVPTYAASANEAAQRAFVLPYDTAKNKLIVSLHYYEPFDFALKTGEGSVTSWSADKENDTKPITNALDLAYELFVSKGIPVIMGEMGAINRDNLEARVAWAEFYTAYAKSKGIPCFWWDNGSYWVLRQREWGWEQTFGLLDRENIIIAHPQIVEALKRGTD